MQEIMDFDSKPFLSTPSARRATLPPVSFSYQQCYFYPRPPRGGRRGQFAQPVVNQDDFYPRPPRGGRRANYWAVGDTKNFYPRPPRGGRRGCWQSLKCSVPISIHALREEGDRFSIRLVFWQQKFLSTPSARRATHPARRLHPRRNISIHALREEGDPCGWTSTPAHSYFYPRPPRGGRLILHVNTSSEVQFLSTPSARRAT